MGALFFKEKPRKGLNYTPRQQAILNDNIPYELIRATELAALMKRTLEREDNEAYEIARGYYDAKMHPCEYVQRYSAEEAKAILQQLTPWDIMWDIENNGTL